jgi:hypothetical protein
MLVTLISQRVQWRKSRWGGGRPPPSRRLCLPTRKSEFPPLNELFKDSHLAKTLLTFIITTFIGELSSISGSESDSAEEILTTGNPESIPLMTLSLLPDERKIHTEVDRSNPKVYFVNESGIHMCLFREVVYGTKVIDAAL